MAKVKSKTKPAVKEPKPINWRTVARRAKRTQRNRDVRQAEDDARDRAITDAEWMKREAFYRRAGYAVARDGSIIRMATGKVVGAIFVRR